MTLQPIKDVSEYKRSKQTLRDRFDNERTGDQNLFEERSKKYKPLLTSQQEISNAMQDAAKQIVESQNEGHTALQPLLPLLQNIQRTQITQQIAAPRRQTASIAINDNDSIKLCYSSSFFVEIRHKNNTYTSSSVSS